MGIDNIPGPKVFIQRDVRRTATASITVAQQLSPIGSIVAWAKTLAGVPALAPGWVQCDGQVLSDVDSLLDGTTIPDLNGDNQFMRGNSTSGAIGGAETNNLAHTHDISGTTGNEGSHTHSFALDQVGDINVGTTGADWNNEGTTGAGSSHNHSFSDTSDSKLSASQENRPPFYNVVWIMRIK